MVAYDVVDFSRPIEIEPKRRFREVQSGEVRRFSEWIDIYAPGAARIFGPLIPSPGRAFAIERVRAGCLEAVSAAPACAGRRRHRSRR